VPSLLSLTTESCSTWAEVWGRAGRLQSRRCRATYSSFTFYCV